MLVGLINVILVLGLIGYAFWIVADLQNKFKNGDKK